MTSRKRKSHGQWRTCTIVKRRVVRKRGYSKEENERAENTRNHDEEKIENVQCDENRNKRNGSHKKEGGKVKGDPFEEIYHDDENNGFN